VGSRNSPKTGRKPTRGGFKPGDPRINRHGRPPLTEEQRSFKELCREKSRGALERLEKIAKGKNATSFVVRANEVIIEHAWGKPKQEQDIDINLKAEVKGPSIYLPREDADPASEQ